LRRHQTPVDADRTERQIHQYHHHLCVTLGYYLYPLLIVMRLSSSSPHSLLIGILEVALWKHERAYFRIRVIVPELVCGALDARSGTDL
jgi:hypothetical protein